MGRGNEYVMKFSSSVVGRNLLKAFEKAAEEKGYRIILSDGPYTLFMYNGELKKEPSDREMFVVLREKSFFKPKMAIRGIQEESFITDDPLRIVPEKQYKEINFESHAYHTNDFGELTEEEKKITEDYIEGVYNQIEKIKSLNTRNRSNLSMQL